MARPAVCLRTDGGPLFMSARRGRACRARSLRGMASAEAATQRDTGGGTVRGSVTRGRRARWWVRRGSKGRFRYEHRDGQRVTDEEALARIRALAIPPAWREVRVSPSPRSALQAIGVDTSGRVQRVY